MYRATVDTNKIRITNPDGDVMTSGSSNVSKIEFTFSEDWTGIFKTLVFQTSVATIPVVLEGDELVYTVTIPWEVLKVPGKTVSVGVYGTRSNDVETEEDEGIVIPTVWGIIPNRVREGVTVEEPTPVDPTYDAYQALLEEIQKIIEGGGGGGSSTTDHSKLTNRDLADQHPIDAITGLNSAIASLQTSIDNVDGKIITSHEALSNRDSADQHPMSAIAGLVNKFTQTDRTIEQVVSFIQSVASMLAGRSVLFATVDEAGLPKANDVETYSRNEFVGIMPVVSETVRIGFLMLDDTLYLANYTVTDVQGTDTTITFVSDPTLIGPTPGGGEPTEQRFTWLGYNDTGWNYVYDSQIGTWYDDTIFVHNFAHIIGDPKPGDPGIVFNLYKTGQYPPSLNLCTYKEAVLGTDGNVSHHSAWSNVHIPMDTIPMVRNYEFRNGVMARNKLSLAENGEPVIVWMNDNVKLILSNAATTADEYIKLIGPVKCWDKDFTPTADQTQFAECDRANYFHLFDGKTYIMPYKSHEVETNPKAYYHGYILEEPSSGGGGEVDIGIPIYRDLTITNGRQSRALIPSGLGYDKPIVIFSNVRVEKPGDHSGNTYTGVYQIAQHNYHDETVANSFAFFVRELDQTEVAYIFSSDDTDRNFVKSELIQSAYSKEAIDAQIDDVSTGLPIFKDMTITNGIDSAKLFGGMAFKSMYAIFSNVRVENNTGKYNKYTGIVRIEQHGYQGDIDAFYVRIMSQSEYAYLYDTTTADKVFTELVRIQPEYSESDIDEKVDELRSSIGDSSLFYVLSMSNPSSIGNSITLDGNNVVGKVPKVNDKAYVLFYNFSLGLFFWLEVVIQSINLSNINAKITSRNSWYDSDKVCTKLGLTSKLENYVTKADVVNVYKFKGSVPVYENLPTSGQTGGDVYNVEDTGMNYAWVENAELENGGSWDPLGSSVDIDQSSLVREKTQAEYDALTDEEKKGMVVITDAEPSGGGGSGDSIPTGVIVIWSGASDAIPAGWALCDGKNGTPDLRDRFVLGAGTTYAVGNRGGSKEVTLTVEQMPKHNHLITVNGTVETTSSIYRINTTVLGNSNAYRETPSAVVKDTGSSQPHNNMPPYYTLAYIMKL